MRVTLPVFIRRSNHLVFDDPDQLAIHDASVLLVVDLPFQHLLEFVQFYEVEESLFIRQRVFHGGNMTCQRPEANQSFFVFLAFQKLVKADQFVFIFTLDETIVHKLDSYLGLYQ